MSSNYFGIKRFSVGLMVEVNYIHENLVMEESVGKEEEKANQG